MRDVLCRGHIFLNTSLTESFCIAILEAACCGLLVVSTDVGGVPEVLPPHMAYLAKPDAKSIIKQLSKAVQDIRKINTENWNSELSEIYNWRTVAERTEKVYNYISVSPTPNVLDRIKSAFSCGTMFGWACMIFLILEFVVLALCEYFFPDCDIDIAHTFDS